MANRYINATLRFYDKFSAPMEKAANRVKGVTGKLMQQHDQYAKIGKQLDRTGRNMARTGTGLTKSVTAPIAGIVGASLRAGTEFDAQMSKVQAISGATGTQLTQLREKAKEMGATTKFSATEAGQAMEYMAMAGWKTHEMKAGLSGVMNLAAASGEDLAMVSDIVTDGLTAFKMGAEESERFADVLAKTAASANTNVSMMGETFKYVAPVAGTLGYKVEDMAKGIGLMANGSVKASQAGTSLRTGLANMASGKFDAQMKKYGISITDSSGKMKSFQQVMENFRSSMGKLSKQEQVAAVTSIVGKNAQAGWLNIVNASDKDFKKLIANIDNSKGSAAEMAEVMLKNNAGALTILKSGLEAAGIAINDRLAPYVTKIIKLAQSWVDKFNALSPKTQDIIIKAALLAAGLGPVLIVVGKTISRVGGLFKTLSKVGRAFDAAGGAGKFFAEKFPHITKGAKAARSALTRFSGNLSLANLKASKLGTTVTKVSQRFPLLGKMGRMFASPWGLAIGVVGAGLVGLYKKNDDFRKSVNTSWKAMKTALAPSVKGMMSEFSKLMTSLKPVIGIIGKALGQAVTAAAKGMIPIIQTVGPALVKAFKLIGSVVRSVAPAFSRIIAVAMRIVIAIINRVSGAVRKLMPVFRFAFNGIIRIVRSVAGPISGVFNGVMKVLGGIITFISGVFSGNWGKAWEGVKKIFKGIMDTLGSIIKAPLNAVISAVNFVIDGLNKISIDVPDWVPGVGGKHFGFNISHIAKLEKGTPFFSGGMALVGERGPEIVQLPHGSRVNTNKESKKMMSGKTVIVNKLADKIVVREEADIDRIATALARKLEDTEPNVISA